MDKRNNILLAKKYMVESIYRSANVEGIGVTFPETQTICDGMSVAGHSVDDIYAVTDLKRAWQWIFENVDAEIGVDTLCQLNRICGKYTVINAGSIRDMYDEPIRVPISEDKDYYPPLPPKRTEIDSLLKRLTYERTVDCALDLFCEVCKNQYFNDGNKRTATLITNLFMIQNGLGILSIPVKMKLEFYNVLTSYYDDNFNKSLLKTFLSSYCLTGSNAIDRNKALYENINIEQDIDDDIDV